MFQDFPATFENTMGGAPEAMESQNGEGIGVTVAEVPQLLGAAGSDFCHGIHRDSSHPPTFTLW